MSGALGTSQRAAELYIGVGAKGKIAHEHRRWGSRGGSRTGVGGERAGLEKHKEVSPRNQRCQGKVLDHNYLNLTRSLSGKLNPTWLS